MINKNKAIDLAVKKFGRQFQDKRQIVQSVFESNEYWLIYKKIKYKPVVLGGAPAVLVNKNTGEIQWFSLPNCPANAFDILDKMEEVDAS
jgi:hypothetical protein